MPFSVSEVSDKQVILLFSIYAMMIRFIRSKQQSKMNLKDSQNIQMQ